MNNLIQGVRPRHFSSLFLLALLLATLARASVETDFQAAREAYQKGRMDRFQKYAERIPADHLLAPYIRYWRLKSNDPPVQAQLDFIARHPDSHLADRLRGDLARQFGKEENWPAFREQFQTLLKPDQELQCLALRARLADADKGAEGEGLAQWRTFRDLPSACDALFATLAERGVLSLEDRMLRLRLALDANNLRLAREVDAGLPEALRMEADALARAQRQDLRLLANPGERRAQREAGLHVLTRLAKDEPVAAARLWEQDQLAYTEEERQFGWAQVGMHAARLHDARALDWFAKAGVPRTEPQFQWKTRAALRAGNWVETYRTIDAMPDTMQNEPVWRYWKARALKALNAAYPANQLFARLSREIHYYGLLAEEELPAKLEARPADYKVTPDDLKSVESLAGFQRALLLRRLGDTGNAVAEWERTLRGLEDRLLLAAAELARREEWYDRAIITAEKTRDVHDFDLRYLAPYRDLASAYAQENGLDEAWVFGLMRQESRFVDYARSSVGAQGLMQIMPATAKWIARQLGLKANAHKEVGRPETNIRFGTYYLKRIFDGLDQSPVLATAGYNAGPGRARKWQAATPLEGAIYVENIPFAETRDYVKKVLANAMFYRARFGGVSQSLKDRLGVIPPRPGTPAPDRDEAAPQPE
ncbi:MAG: transglycosylase SLT domain-containing protein [Pseudomonadota bacterium]